MAEVKKSKSIEETLKESVQQEAPKKKIYVSDEESGVISRTSSRESEMARRRENKELFDPKKEEELRKRSEEYVRGKFVFSQRPGDTLKFPYREFKGQDCVQYAFKDGETYTIPMGVAQHINKRVVYPVHENTTDARGNSKFQVKQWVNRASFQIYEFVERDDNSFSIAY